jgi:hypothetical protein
MYYTQTIKDKIYTMHFTGEGLGTLWVRSVDGANKYYSNSTIVFKKSGKIRYGKENGWHLPVEFMINCDKIYKRLLKINAFI